MVDPQRRVIGRACWRLEVHEETSSTNDMARSLTAWSAVRAVRQTAGRGRFGRAFVSDPGGFWISAVLPAPGHPREWTGFSLMVGCHLLAPLVRLGVPEARLRWPNDLMAGDKKLGGILIEQGQEVLIVGLGLNVVNTPWHHAPEIASYTTRLCDELARHCVPDELDEPVLDALADAHAAMLTGGPPEAVRRFNAQWIQPRRVEVTLLDGARIEGDFSGLDSDGHLLMGSLLIPHNEVGRLREL